MPENSSNHSERLARIEAKLDAYREAQESRWEEIDKRLFGNGQPGIIDRFDARICKLEQFRYWLGGLIFTGSTAGGMFGSKILKLFGISI